jgi:hypothetical protein
MGLILWRENVIDEERYPVIKRNEIIADTIWSCPRDTPVLPVYFSPKRVCEVYLHARYKTSPGDHFWHNPSAHTSPCRCFQRSQIEKVALDFGFERILRGEFMTCGPLKIAL